MKIVLCFSGQPRTVKESYEASIYKNLIKVNNITDIFAHIWWRKEWDECKSWNRGDGWSQGFNLHTINNIKTLYNPLKMEVEDDTDYHDFIKENFINNPNYISREKTNIINWYPKYFSIYESNRLKNEYEKEQNFEYDMIIRLRFDTFLKFPVYIKDLDIVKLHVPTYASNPHKGDELWTADCGVADTFAIGNKKNMDIYCNLVNCLHDLAKKHPNSVAEGTVGNYLKDNNVPVYKSWFYADGTGDDQINVLRRS